MYSYTYMVSVVELVYMKERQPIVLNTNLLIADGLYLCHA